MLEVQQRQTDVATSDFGFKIRAVLGWSNEVESLKSCPTSFFYSCDIIIF